MTETDDITGFGVLRIARIGILILSIILFPVGIPALVGFNTGGAARKADSLPFINSNGGLGSAVAAFIYIMAGLSIFGTAGLALTGNLGVIPSITQGFLSGESDPGVEVISDDFNQYIEGPMNATSDRKVNNHWNHEFLRAANEKDHLIRNATTRGNTFYVSTRTTADNETEAFNNTVELATIYGNIARNSWHDESDWAADRMYVRVYGDNKLLATWRVEEEWVDSYVNEGVNQKSFNSWVWQTTESRQEDGTFPGETQYLSNFSSHLDGQGIEVRSIERQGDVVFVHHYSENASTVFDDLEVITAASAVEVKRGWDIQYVHTRAVNQSGSLGWGEIHGEWLTAYNRGEMSEEELTDLLDRHVHGQSYVGFEPHPGEAIPDFVEINGSESAEELAEKARRLP